MKRYTKGVGEVLSLLLFEVFLLALTSAAGEPVKRVALCGMFFGIGAFIRWKKPLKALPVGKGVFHLLHFLGYFAMILATIRAKDHAATMGVLAVLPANIGLLAVLLLDPLARRLKEGPPDPPQA
mgnify:CR=1 FL=1